MWGLIAQGVKCAGKSPCFSPCASSHSEDWACVCHNLPTLGGQSSRDMCNSLKRKRPACFRRKQKHFSYIHVLGVVLTVSIVVWVFLSSEQDIRLLPWKLNFKADLVSWIVLTTFFFNESQNCKKSADLSSKTITKFWKSTWSFIFSLWYMKMLNVTDPFCEKWWWYYCSTFRHFYP